MDLVQLSITDDQLKQSNELTRASVKPGYLDHAAYRQYLIMHGHVDPARVAAAGSAPTIPQNSNLQVNNGDRTDDMTDYRADQALWSQDNLPEVIYVFQKPTNRFSKKDLREPPKKTYAIYGAILRDIPILPDHIASDVEGWRIETYFRFDARVSLIDIMDRIEPANRPTGKSVLNMRSFRFREDCMVLGWCAMGTKYAERKREIENEMSVKGISPARNSTRGVSWGLVDPATGPHGPRIAVPNHRRIKNTVDLTGIGSNAVITLSAPAFTQTHAPQTQLSILPPSKPSKLKLLSNDAELDGDYIETSEANDTSIMGDDLPSLPYNEIDMEYWPTVDDNAPVQPKSKRSAEPVLSVMYAGELLVLKTHDKRVKEAEKAAELLSKWCPYGSESRKEQLAYLLDPERLAGGFVDNVGYWRPVGVQSGCIEADIVYGAKAL